MFRRIIHEHWTDLVPIVGFLLTFAVFMVAVVRALRLNKDRCKELASLPLEAEAELSVEDDPTTAPANLDLKRPAQ